MLLKWQSIILNRIYQTTNFDKIVLKSTNIDQIDYSQSIDIYKHTININEIDMPSQLIKTGQFIQLAHLLCKSKNLQQKKEKILFFNKLMPDINKQIQNNKPLFNIFHVILFSSLSKCTIWPSMFKTSRAMVPHLIQFYNRFFNSFTQYLEYKFDPLILSSKYSRLVKQIKEKKLAHPELFESVQTNNIQKIKDIIKNGEENLINQCMKNCCHITHIAAIHSSLQTIKTLYDLKANFQLLDNQQQTPLFYAVKRFDLEIIKFLVQVVKVDINHKQYQNRTPIYLAAFQGNLEIVNYLYTMGGNPQIESKLARTPLSKACYLGNVKVAQFLIKLGVKLESVDSKGRTALHNAAWGIEGGREGKRRGHIKLEDSPECVELLIKAGHRVDFQDNDKFTPLFSAISSHAERSLRILIKYGGNLKHKTVKNQTAVFIACKYGHLEILKILIEQFNCDCFQQNFQGYSPLMATLTLQNNECFIYMLNFYFQKGIRFSLTLKTISCIDQFQKWDNLSYLLDWINNSNDKQLTKQQKSTYIAQSFEENAQQIIEYVFVSKNDKIINIVLSLINVLQEYIHRKIITILMQKLQKYQYINDKAIEIMLHQHNQGFVIPYITLNHFITQETMIKLLQVDSNLTESQDTLYKTFVQVIKQRLTKVVIFLISNISQQLKQHKKEGIYKYNKEQLLGIVYGQNNNKISLIDYSVVNGYYDIHKIFSNFYNQNYEVGDIKMQQRPVIPKYRYQVKQLKNPIKSYLMSIKNAKTICNFQYLFTNFLNQKQKQLYQKVSKDIKQFKIDHLIVKQLNQLEQMKNHLNNHHLIGIDVEHYSSNNQSFICLIQIATLQRAFIIDRFNLIYQEISLYLKQLFLNQQKIKIFHSYDNDLKWLVQNYEIEEFYCVIDTSRIYGLIENQKGYTPSLKTLAEKYLNLKINKQYQRSDWRIRPLFSEMIDYAATDAKVLPYLLLRMVEQQQQKLVTNKNQSLEIIKYMESKRMIKSSGHVNVIQII